MKRVIVLVGPQCAGKSTFCAQAVAQLPGVAVISRDVVFKELFGTPYVRKPEDYHRGMRELWARATRELASAGSTTILFDVYAARAFGLYGWYEMTEKFPSLGTDRVEAWHFVTPFDQCSKWMEEREPYAGPWWSLKRWRQNSARKEYLRTQWNQVHTEWASAEHFFDAVRKVDPRTTTLADLLP